MQVRYSQDHQYIIVEDGVGTVGITNYAQERLNELTLLQGLFSPITNFPTTRRNAGSSQSCKASILWCSSLAAAASAPRTADKLKGFLSFIVRWRLAIAALSRSVPTTSPRRTNIA